MLAGIVAFIVACLIGYVFIRRVTYNVFDPIVITNIFVPFAAAFLTVLCSTGLAPWSKLLLFWVVLVAYLAGMRVVGAFFNAEILRQRLAQTLAAFGPSEVTVILFCGVALTLFLAILGWQAGAQGDAAQEFRQIHRPLVVLHSGLTLFGVILLLRSKSASRALPWLLALIVPTFTFSSKQVFLPILLWFGLKFFLDRKRMTLMRAAALSMIVLIGIAVMGALAYGVANSKDVVLLVANRLWLSGDTYYYAYQLEGLEILRGYYDIPFFFYALHPITALFGIRAYEKPLGGELLRAATGIEVVGGPNPHLPVLMDYFFSTDIAISMLVAFVTGILVCSLRPLGISLAASRSRYLRLGGMAAAIFCPPTGFIDTSQVLISLIGVGITTALCMAFELVLSPAKDINPASAR